MRKFRGRGNVLGAAGQLCTLAWLGLVPGVVASAPAAAVARLPARLGVPAGKLRGYGAREQTRTDHLREIIAYLGWRAMDGPGWKDLEELLFARAMEHDSPRAGSTPGPTPFAASPAGPSTPSDAARQPVAGAHMMTAISSFYS